MVKGGTQQVFHQLRILLLIIGLASYYFEVVGIPHHVPSHHLQKMSLSFSSANIAETSLTQPSCYQPLLLICKYSNIQERPPQKRFGSDRIPFAYSPNYCICLPHIDRYECYNQSRAPACIRRAISSFSDLMFTFTIPSTSETTCLSSCLLLRLCA